jgi:hypothetical protein
MDKRAILISLAVAVVALLSSKVLYKWHGIATNYIYSETGNFIHPLFSALSQPINSLSWFLPGMVAGFLCTKSPIKHGAVSGAVYGLALGLLGIALASSQTHDISTKVTQLSYAVVVIFKSSVLFSVSAAFGYQLNKRRIVL